MAADGGGGLIEWEDGGNSGEEDQNNLGSRKKLRLSREQSAFLEHSFKDHHTLYPVRISSLHFHIHISLFLFS